MATHTATTQNSDKTTISMKMENDSWLQLSDVTSVGIPRGFDTEQIDVTHLSSPGNSREYIGGRSPAPSISVAINYVPGSETESAIWGAKGQNRDFKVEYPNGYAHSFTALVQTWDAGQAAVGAVFQGTLTLQISGEVTETEPA